MIFRKIYFYPWMVACLILILTQILILPIPISSSAVELCQAFMREGAATNSGLSVLRTFRLLRILKLVRFMPNLRRQLFVMLRTMDNVAIFFSLLILFIFIFRWVGVRDADMRLNKYYDYYPFIFFWLPLHIFFDMRIYNWGQEISAWWFIVALSFFDLLKMRDFSWNFFDSKIKNSCHLQRQKGNLSRRCSTRLLFLIKKELSINTKRNSLLKFLISYPTRKDHWTSN